MIFHPLIIVTFTVLLGVASALLLKEASSLSNLSWLAIGAIWGAVLLVNGCRFVLWGHTHRRYPVSLSYPLGSIFFPLILLVGHFFYGEPVTVLKLIASLLIMCGIGLLAFGEEHDDV